MADFNARFQQGLFERKAAAEQKADGIVLPELRNITEDLASFAIPIDVIFADIRRDIPVLRNAVRFR